ncbi:oligopeptide ABC transporter permease protein [Roseobacter sp. MED193]|uniref:ABC transporter permease n=1 Tax=Roseobacter sp. MED193 TaxID=314262 RepID=UPI000068A060|nr:ABC transporter permease [Roseobacter sp. MED193]EAQ43972.1 oligopeptide ABC transporter permease protein [Roseobacter sp. MED193]
MNLRPLIHHWLEFHRADRLAGFASLTMATLILAALLAPLLPIDPPDQVAAYPRLSPPSADIVFGSDNLGRNMLSRVLQGIQVTILLATTAVLCSALAGIVIGLIAAYSGKVLDEIISRLSDIVFSFPAVLMGLLITAIIGPGEFAAICAIILVTLPPMVRVVRAAAMDVTGADFVTISKLSGASPARQLLVHILPNIAVPVVTQVAYSISVGMLVESALSFLGLGSQPPAASLGSLLREGSLYITFAPWLVFAPALFLVLAIWSVNLIGEGMRVFFDPVRARSLED